MLRPLRCSRRYVIEKRYNRLLLMHVGEKLMSVTIHKRDASEFISCHFHYFEKPFHSLYPPDGNKRHILFSQLFLHITGVLFHFYTKDASLIASVILKISVKKNKNSLRNAQIYPMYSCGVVKESYFFPI